MVTKVISAAMNSTDNRTTHCGLDTCGRIHSSAIPTTGSKATGRRRLHPLHMRGRYRKYAEDMAEHKRRLAETSIGAFSGLDRLNTFVGTILKDRILQPVTELLICTCTWPSICIRICTRIWLAHCEDGPVLWWPHGRELGWVVLWKTIASRGPKGEHHSSEPYFLPWPVLEFQWTAGFCQENPVLMIVLKAKFEARWSKAAEWVPSQRRIVALVH